MKQLPKWAEPMIPVYLITGFLGAGKTTFLKNFIRLMAPCRMHIIVNEFGREGIDGALLEEIGAAVDEISNGSIFCSCRLDKFEEVLEKALREQKPEMIVIEASGLSNPANARKILEDSRFADAVYKGSICLVDAVRFPKVYETAVVCKKQLGISDVVVINKTDLASASQTEKTKQMILAQRPDVRIYETSYGKIEKSWIGDLKDPVRTAGEDVVQTQDVTLRSRLVDISPAMTLAQLEKFLGMFIENTYRIKGFACLDGKQYLVDCTGTYMFVKPYEGRIVSPNRLVVLSGSSLHLQKALKEALRWYEGLAWMA